MTGNLNEQDVVLSIVAEDGKTYSLLYDSCPENPRTEWDNLGVMCCFKHRMYLFGDDYVKLGYPMEPQEALARIQKGTLVGLPLYVYIHSGISMSTSNAGYPFNDIWDTGLAGVIYVPPNKIREEYKCKRITASIKQKVINGLIAEVEAYDQFLRGDVYGIVIEDQDGEFVDSCWGYYGYDYAKQTLEELVAECQSTI